VQLQSLNPIYADFGVPQQSGSQVKVGGNVTITAQDLAGKEFTGRVTALDSVIDEATRNYQVQATLANPQGKLKPGMFVQVAMHYGKARDAVTLPARPSAMRPTATRSSLLPTSKILRGIATAACASSS